MKWDQIMVQSPSMNKADHSAALAFYKGNQADLVSKYNGKTLILSGSEILAVKDSIKDAYDFAVEHFGIGNFSLQEVSEGPNSYTSYIVTPIMAK